ncbi:DDE-type integrase/transposase/recombinase [Actinomyces viscosus]
MHVMRGRPEAAERHGAGHVARCTVERLMADLGLRGVRRARSPRTTRSAPREQCPADLVKRHFSAFRPNELWVADITYVRTFSGWVYVAFVTDVYSRRIIGWQTTYRPVCTDLAAGALQMAVWQRKRAGADLTGLVHHSDRGVQYRSIRYGQALAECEAVASVGSKGDLLSALLWPRRSTRCTRPSSSLGQGPWQDIDAARGCHRRVGPLGGHHPATLRHRDANPRRARSRLGARHQPRPPPPGTITTGNHRNQINQPPQNPGLDRINPYL